MFRNLIYSSLISGAGIKQYEDPETNRAIAESANMLARMDADMVKSNYAWAKKCFKYADERSK